MRDWAELKLWPHQQRAIEMCNGYFAAGSARAALVQLPTGTGKTGVMAVVAARQSEVRPVLIVCPSAALAQQLQDNIRADFWTEIGADLAWAPDQVIQLLPKDIDDVEAALQTANTGRRIVVVGTVQALQQLHAENEDGYAKLKGAFGTVMFDEGHREPAPAWADAVRGIGAPTILFSATPFRNDLKMFDVDLAHVAFVSFQEAVDAGLIRGVEVMEDELPNGPREFARAMIAARTELLQKGRVLPDHKMIVRADRAEDVRALFDAFCAELRHDNAGVLALHNTFKPEAGPGGEIRPDVPADLRKRKERFLIHQFMLTEGIDDPACTMLALFEPFSTERQLVQQVGRLTRHPKPIGRRVDEAVVFARRGDGVEAMWQRFLAFDRACVRNGGKPPLRNDRAVLEGIVAATPDMDYVGGRFRTRLDLNADLSEDLLVPRSAVVFDLQPDFDMDGFREAVSEALEQEDRSEVRRSEVGRNAGYHVTLRLNQSPFLSESLFQSASLEVTIYARQGDRLYFYDSGGVWIDEVRGLTDRLGAASLRRLLPEDPECVVTSVTMKNTDLGRLAVRTRAMSATSLERAGVFMGEQLNVVTRAAGRVGQVRRALSLARSRVRQGEGPVATPAEYVVWTEQVERDLARQVRSAALFGRFAEPAPIPGDTTPQNILVDLDTFASEFLNEAGKTAVFDLETLCVDVVGSTEGPEDFDLRFGLTVDGEAADVWIKWDGKRKKYWLHSPQLSRLKDKENPRISLVTRLNQKQCFRIITATPGVIYAFGGFYSVDLNLAQAGGLGSMVRSLVTGVPGLREIASEKGMLTTRADTWPDGSLFNFIDAALRPGDAAGALGPRYPALICDDIGQEAADFVAADPGSATTPPRATLIAAKAKAEPDEKETGVSASVMYDVCGQIVKNLAFLKVDAQELPGSQDKWNEDWKLNGGRVPRIRAGGDARAFRRLFREVRARPTAARQMWIVLGGGMLSERALKTAFERSPPEPHVLQFFHLVLATYSACQSVGVDLRIFCAE